MQHIKKREVYGLKKDFWKEDAQQTCGVEENHERTSALVYPGFRQMAKIGDNRPLQVLWGSLERQEFIAFQGKDNPHVVQIIASKKPEASCNMGTNEQAGQEMAA